MGEILQKKKDFWKNLVSIKMLRECDKNQKY